MMVSNASIAPWADKPLGKAARLTMAIAGMLLATSVMMTAAVVDQGSWALVLLGVALGAASVRAAHWPTISRLAALGAVVLAIPTTMLVF